MDTNTIINFIDKVIEKTKNGDLSWTTLPPHHHLKSLPGDESVLLPSLLSGMKLSCDDSFIATYKTGEIILLVYVPSDKMLIISPPDDCILSLRVQDQKSKYSTEISCNAYDPVDAAALIRLYNLLSKDSSNLSKLINEFLNS